MKPGQTDTFQPDPDMDRLLREVGDAWAEDSCRSSERFMASFDSTLRRLGPAPRRETVRPGWTWRRWLLPALAVAACVIGIPVFLYQQSSVTGTILFQEGDLVVQGSGRNSRELAKGSLIASGENGQGYLSLDRDRINLFVQRKTEVTLTSSDSIRLARGEIWVRVDPGSGFFGVSTPHGFVHVQGTTFGVRVSPEETQVEIAAGKVLVGTEKNRTLALTPGTGANLSYVSDDPVPHESREDITPSWAEDLFSRAAASRAEAFFPSAAPPHLP